MTTMTMEKLMDAMRLVEKIEAATCGPIYPTPFNGVRVFEDHNALADTTERKFPESRHRSARVRKKLIKRHGSEFVKVPTMFQINGDIYAHPVRYRELLAAFQSRS